MKLIERIIYIIIIAALGYFLFQKPKPIIEYKTIKGDSIPYEVLISHDSMIYTDTGSYNVDTLWLHDTLYLPTDTAAILADYFNMISYDSILLKNDSSITAWVDLNITQNRLYNIKGYFLNNRETSIIVEENNKFDIGMVVGQSLFAPTASYQYKHHEFGLGYNFMNNGFLLEYKYRFNNVSKP